MFQGRQFVLLGMLLSAVFLGYFYLLDRVIFTSAYFSPIFQRLLMGFDSETMWLAFAVCFLSGAWSKPALPLRLVDTMASKPLWVAASSVVAIAAGSLFVYRSYPLSMDEYSAVFQAKIFAAGRLSADLPPSVLNWLVWPEFNGMFLVASSVTGHAIETYWPGFALLLAPFEFLGVPWLCNALLAGLAVYLVYLITLDVADDRRAAGWAMLFTLASSAFLANAISYYSMQAHLTANLLFVWLLLRPSPMRALAAGLVGSLALVLHNPLPHLLFGAPWVFWLVADRSQRRNLAPLFLGYAPGAVVGVGWLWLRMAMVPSASAHSLSLDGVFTFPDWVTLDIRAASTVKLWLWAVPCLFLIALRGFVECRKKVPVTLLAQSAVLTFVGYLFVRLDQGHGWGYRYFHSAWGAIPILAGCAMSKKAQPGNRLESFAGAASVLSLLVLIPFQMDQIQGIISRHLAQIPRPQAPGNNVYFLTGSGGFYMADMIQIDPFLRDSNLLLASRGPELDAALSRQNWPHALLKGHGEWGEQWYLGDLDQRRTGGSATDAKHFILAFNPDAARAP